MGRLLADQLYVQHGARCHGLVDRDVEHRGYAAHVEAPAASHAVAAQRPQALGGGEGGEHQHPRGGADAMLVVIGDDAQRGVGGARARLARGP